MILPFLLRGRRKALRALGKARTNEGGDTGRRIVENSAYLRIFETMRDTPSVQPPAEAAGRRLMPAGSALYTQYCAEIKKCCIGGRQNPMGGLAARFYDRDMARSVRCLATLLAAGLGSLAMGPAHAKDPYGLTGLKPYDGAVAAPPANGLAAVIRSQGSSTNGTAGKAKPYDQPLFTIHASGALMIDSVMRR